MTGLYSTARWTKRRRHQLAAEPLCQPCLERGRVTPATVADHVTRWRGTQNEIDAFTLTPLVSMCPSCHSGLKQQYEKRGYSTEIGPDGLPCDKTNHPWYRSGSTDKA